ncbi:MAG TPA: tetratricopeptide repeat protein [Blastocatellia bacterium]
MKYSLKAILVIACVALFCATSRAAAKDRWINVTTKNFNIVSNASDGETRELALKLEQFHMIFSVIFNLRDTNPVPVTVMVFKNDDSFTPFKPLRNGKPDRYISGYFQRGDDENIIALNLDANEEHPMSVIFHEYTHLLTSKSSYDYPLWLKEGLAELYSTFRVRNKEVTLGMPIASHVYLLRQRKLMPIAEMFGVGHGSPAYNEADKKGIFYAQSWALAHYLMYGDKSARRPQMVEFIKLLVKGLDQQRAFTEAFKMDLATAEKELRRYVGNHSYSNLIYTLSSTEGEKNMDLRPLAESEAISYLGNLMLRTGRLEEAEYHFKRAAALDPALARPCEGLGFLALRRNQYEEAAKQFEQAVARDSKNHLAHYYYAEALGSRDGGSTSPELRKKIVSLLKTAIRLQPGFAHSYYLLGFTALASGEELKEGAAMLATAIGLAPEKRHYVLTLAQLQTRMQDYGAAKKTLEPLLAPNSEPHLRSSAESMMKMIDYYSNPNSATAPPPAWRDEKEPPAEPRTEEVPDAGRRPAGQVIGRPTIRIDGAEIVRGVLVRIECAAGNWTLVVNTADKLLRFTVTNLAKLEFYSQDPDFEGSINCGAVGKAAFVYFKPAPAGQAKFAGDAVAIEFTR